MFFTISTRYGILMPSDWPGSAGLEMKVVATCAQRRSQAPLLAVRVSSQPPRLAQARTLLPRISIAELCMSSSVSRFTWPFCTAFSQCCSGLLPMAYSSVRKPP